MLFRSMLDVNFAEAFTMAVLPFIIGDIIKATAAAIFGIKLQKVLGRHGL